MHKAVLKHKVHLPQQLTSFIGRQDEIAKISLLLDDPACRIVTLVGPGGIGKTRMALEIASHKASDFANGAYFVSLQSLKSVENILPAIVDALLFQLQGSQRTPEQQLLDYLREKHLLLVIDNFEHLVEGAALLSDLVRAAPGLKILVTSREVLNLKLEWLRPMRGLALPEIGTPADSDAMRLFIERAQRLQADFDTEAERPYILEICRLVDGMPLAIELATGWLHTINCAGVAREIRQNIDFLASKQRDIPPRHRSIRAVFNHSWRLLYEAERQVLPRLSVFRGGFTREAAEQVAGATLDALTALVEKSFLHRTASGRYDMHELLRQYAEEELESSGESKAVLDTHSQYYAGSLTTSRLEIAQRGIAHHIKELDNIRLALETAVKYGVPERFGKNYYHLYWIYEMNAWYEEGEKTFLALVNAFEAQPQSAEQQLHLGGTLSNYAWFLHRLNRSDEIEAIIRRSIAILDSLELSLVQIWPRFTATLVIARALDREAEVTIQRYLDSIEIFRQFNQDWTVAWIKNGLGERLNAYGRHAEALEHLEFALPVQRHYDMKLGVLWCLEGLGRANLGLGNYTQAKHQIEEALDIAHELRWQYFECSLYVILGEIDVALGSYDSAKQHLITAFDITRDMGDVSWTLYLVAYIAHIFMLEKCDDRAWDYAAFVLHHPLQNEQAVELAEMVMSTLDARITPGRRRGTLTIIDIEHELTADLITLRGLSTQQRANQTLIEPLTERELEILALIAQGMSNQAIADTLVVGISTVKKHITHINAKLDVKSRTQAILLANELHLL